ncbi:MAG: AraC family transcriptional regulator [Bacteroidota bacterium]|nr:AraC family transcriptional regulator [Bacteroidota bacterium]
MKIFIKNMVSNRCKMIVKSELDNLGLEYNLLELGEVELIEKPSAVKNEELKMALLKWDFELMDNRKTILAERVKAVVIEMIHVSKEFPKTNYSDYISKKLLHDYTYLSNVFSEVENITIEHFIIAHKIEKVKELLLYDEYNITEIANMLNYSNVAHLSNQFKKVTGFTPTFFKAMKNKSRTSLEDI